MNWNDLSERARDTMSELGNFGPTTNAKEREVKGYMLDPGGDAGKAYYNSSELRTMAEDLSEVADWLDKRADGT